MKRASLAVILLAAGLVSVAAWQHQVLIRLRSDKTGLNTATAAAGDLQLDSGKLTAPGTLPDPTDEMAQLREASRDLLKLRNEARALRELKAQFEPLRLENERLQARQQAAKSGTNNPAFRPFNVTSENLSSQGQLTPEQSVQTFFWAQREGNLPAAASCLLPERQQRNPEQHQPTGPELAEYFQQKFPTNTTFAVVVRRDLNPDATQLGINIHKTWGENKLLVLARRIGAEWKLDVDLYFP